MSVRKAMSETDGIYFITITNYRWLPLFELSDGYEANSPQSLRFSAFVGVLHQQTRWNDMRLVEEMTECNDNGR